MRVLDLGCGKGMSGATRNLPAEWHLIGADINCERVSQAAHQFPARSFVVATGEKLPFADNTFDRVILGVALPYMNIPCALTEIRRVLIADGELWASLHNFRFMLNEFKRVFPKPVATLFRFRVFFNGIVFNLTARSLGESFQTEHGMRLALRRHRFSNIRFSHDGKSWIVQAQAVVLGDRAAAEAEGTGNDRLPSLRDPDATVTGAS